jgi:hypothetical protein
MIQLLPILLESLNEASIEQLQQIYVDKNIISSEDFEQIKKATNNKGAYATWLAKKVADKIIKTEDIYKYEEYFKIFDKYKAKYPLKDINQYKTRNDVQTFLETTIDIIDNLTKVTGQSTEPSKNLVPLKGVEELKSVGISLLGIVDGYQCFKVPDSLVGNEEAWKIYRKWLAKCGGREEGDSIAICTMGSLDHFNTYLKKGPYYVFFNMKDSDAPYQFHYETNQFKNRKDIEIV